MYTHVQSAPPPLRSVLVPQEPQKTISTPSVSTSSTSNTSSSRTGNSMHAGCCLRKVQAWSWVHDSDLDAAGKKAHPVTDPGRAGVAIAARVSETKLVAMKLLTFRLLSAGLRAHPVAYPQQCGRAGDPIAPRRLQKQTERTFKLSIK